MRGHRNTVGRDDGSVVGNGEGGSNAVRLANPEVIGMKGGIILNGTGCSGSGPCVSHVKVALPRKTGVVFEKQRADAVIALSNVNPAVVFDNLARVGNHHCSGRIVRQGDVKWIPNPKD